MPTSRSLRSRPALHLLLFVITLISIYLSSRPGNPMAVFVQDTPLDSFVFALAVMSILTAHELGHYMAGVVHRIELTLPYFIPAPFAFGTMGAVIRMRRIARRAELLDVGVGGPLAGMALALPFAIAGVAASPVLPLPKEGPVLVLGDGLLFRGLVYWTHGHIPAGYDVYLHPLGLAAWFGFLITALNLMPAGQLDGGHIVKALFNRGHALISRLVFLGLACWGALGDAILRDSRLVVSGTIYAVAAALIAFRPRPVPHARKILPALFIAHVAVGSILNIESLSMPWMIWSVLLFLFRLDHPVVDDGAAPLSLPRRAAGWISLAVFVITFVPVPISIST